MRGLESRRPPLAVAERNPYAPPGADLHLVSAEHCWRDGRQVVLRRGSDLPPRCLCCNEPGRRPARARAYAWHSPWLLLLVPVNILLYALVALLARKTIRLHPVRCAVHRRARRGYGMLCGLLMAAGFALLYLAIPGHEVSARLQPAPWLSPLLLLLAVAMAAWKLDDLSASRIDAGYVRLRGAGKAFLDSLPPWSGPPASGPACGQGGGIGMMAASLDRDEPHVPTPGRLDRRPACLPPGLGLGAHPGFRQSGLP